MPAETWDRLVPYYVRASRLASRLRRQSRRADFDPAVYELYGRAQEIRRILRESYGGWEGNGPGHATELLGLAESDLIAPDGSTPDQPLHVSGAGRPGGRSGPQAPGPTLGIPLERACRGAAYRTAWKVFRRYSGTCSDELFSELQAAALAHWPVEERDDYRLFHDREHRENFCGQQKFDVLECNDLGLGQYLLLSGLSRRRLGPAARDRLGVFRRKFGAVKPLFGAPQRPGADSSVRQSGRSSAQGV